MPGRDPAPRTAQLALSAGTGCPKVIAAPGWAPFELLAQSAKSCRMALRPIPCVGENRNTRSPSRSGRRGFLIFDRLRSRRPSASRPSYGRPSQPRVPTSMRKPDLDFDQKDLWVSRHLEDPPYRRSRAANALNCFRSLSVIRPRPSVNRLCLGTPQQKSLIFVLPLREQSTSRVPRVRGASHSDRSNRLVS